jgi:hypothetical protein
MRPVGWAQAARSVTVSLLCGLPASSAGGAANPIGVGNTRTSINASPGLNVVAGEVDLPAERWEVSTVAPGKVLDQVFLVPAPAAEESAPGRRVQAFDLERRIESGRFAIQAFFMACQEYAAAHDGAGPGAFSDLDQKKWGSLIRSVERSPWPEDAGGKARGPFYFAKPSAVFPFLAKGGDFLFRSGSLFTRSFVDDDLRGRYLRRLGLGEALARKLLESGEVTELGLVTPDLFFIEDGGLRALCRWVWKAKP